MERAAQIVWEALEFLVGLLVPALVQLKDAQTILVELPPIARIAFALGLFVIWTVLSWLVKTLRLRFFTPTQSRIERLQKELDHQRAIHRNVVMFQSHSNLYLSRILLLGFLYVAGPNLQKYADGADKYVFEQLGRLLPEELVDTLRSFVEGFVVPVLFFFLVIFLSRSCKQLWQFNKRHRDFERYCDGVLSVIATLKERLVRDDVRQVHAEFDREPFDQLAAGGTARIEGGSQAQSAARAAPAPEWRSDATTVRSQKSWLSGMVARLDTNRSGVIRVDGRSNTQPGRSPVPEYFFDTGRLVTGQMPAAGTLVMFVEHEITQGGRRAAAAVLVAPLGERAIGTLHKSSSPEARSYRAEIRDAYGNSALVPLVALSAGRDDLATLTRGARVSFRLGAEGNRLIGTEVQHEQRGNIPMLSAVDF